MGRDYQKENAWQKEKYDEIRGKIDKQLGTELRKKLETENKSIATWITENAKKYLKK